MSNNTLNKDIKTLGYVLRRTNYGEADRILNVITPGGKIAVIAKGVRREKSKLAGSIEMFTLTDYNIHKGKSEFGIITGARMKKYYGKIIGDLAKMELAAAILKKVSKVAESSDSPEYFKIVDQSLDAINSGEKMDMIESWYLLNLKRAMGEEMNLYFDVAGEKLAVGKKYDWDRSELAFFENENGEYGSDEIKLMRLMVSSDLAMMRRVKMERDLMPKVLRLVRMVV